MNEAELQLNFSPTHKELYKTACPSRDNSPNTNNGSESIEIVVTPSNTISGLLQESILSSASTNNTDICVLEETHYGQENVGHSPDGDDEYVDGEPDSDEVFLRSIDILEKAEEFTIVQKPARSRRVCKCEESSEILMLISSEYYGKRRPTYSGTDSDVEVLMSEEIIDSDWSEHHDHDLRETPKFNDNKEGEENGSTSCMKQQPSQSQSPTDFDGSAGDFRDGANSNYDGLGRTQLLQVIQKQEVLIQSLEDTVKKYQKSQQKLFDYVDALRLELNSIHISPLGKNVMDQATAHEK
uniref:Uncharacterized protein n=1 Tax=Glossina austeni TaxID=7395 RepID=A0A1A9UDG1_GLOAU